MIVTLACALAALCVLAALAAWAPGRQAGAREIAAAGAAILAVAALWHVYGLVRRHFRDLDRARGAIVTLTGDRSAVLPRYEAEDTGLEIERLYGALADLTARYAEERAAPDRKLGAILASVAEALVVITEQGQVSLVNYPAKALLGGERVRIGTSVFAALERGPVIAALERARQEGGAVEATLRTVEGTEIPARILGLEEHGGAVLSFTNDLAEHRAEVSHDLALHDRPPARGSLSDDTRIADLHATVLDTETTGLIPAVDRVVSIGAVRVCGGRLYRGMSFDRLVRPGVPIPARSTAVHGITDAMVTDAEVFPAVFAGLAPLVRDTVWVGHNIAFDIAMLRQECALAGLSWAEPVALDTLLLASALKLEAPGLSLENLAAHFSVDVHGRHTALGDSLVTAEIFIRMLPLLAEAGVETLGDAVRFSRRAKAVIAKQKAAGW